MKSTGIEITPNNHSFSVDDFVSGDVQAQFSVNVNLEGGTEEDVEGELYSVDQGGLSSGFKLQVKGNNTFDIIPDPESPPVAGVCTVNVETFDGLFSDTVTVELTDEPEPEPEPEPEE